MKLNKNFIFHTLDGEAVLVPTADAPFHGLIQGNKTVGAVLEMLSAGADEEDLVEGLSARFDGTRAEIMEDVASVLSKLRSVGAIDD